jgi:hypothetical protein
MRVRNCERTCFPWLETATVPEQVAAIVPKISAVASEIAPVAPDVGEVPADIAPPAKSQIAAQIAKIPSQIGTVTPEVEPVRSDIPAVGADVGSLFPPTGRGSGRSQSDDHGSGGESDDGCANHVMSPVSSAAPIILPRPEPGVAAGFMPGSSMCGLDGGEDLSLLDRSTQGLSNTITLDTKALTSRTCVSPQAPASARKSSLR